MKIVVHHIAKRNWADARLYTMHRYLLIFVIVRYIINNVMINIDLLWVGYIYMYIRTHTQIYIYIERERLNDACHTQGWPLEMANGYTSHGIPLHFPS